jgi:hypothetical protein
MALKNKTLFYYGLTDLPITMSLFPVVVFIPMYYTGEMGVSLGLAAMIMLAVRVSDVFTDPFFWVYNRSVSNTLGKTAFLDCTLDANHDVVGVPVVSAATRRWTLAHGHMDVCPVDCHHDDDHPLLRMGGGTLTRL